MLVGNVWFKCKGCGQPAAFFGDGLAKGGQIIPRGAVCHTKPERFVNQPGTVPCALYNQTSPQEFAALHADAERIEDPSSFVPVLP